MPVVTMPCHAQIRTQFHVGCNQAHSFMLCAIQWLVSCYVQLRTYFHVGCNQVHSFMFCAIFKCFVSHVRCIQIPSPMPCATRTLVSCHVQLRTQFSCGAYLGPQLYGVCKLMSQLHVRCNQNISFTPRATMGLVFMWGVTRPIVAWYVQTNVLVACEVQLEHQFHATCN